MEGFNSDIRSGITNLNSGIHVAFYFNSGIHACKWKIFKSELRVFPSNWKSIYLNYWTKASIVAFEAPNICEQVRGHIRACLPLKLKTVALIYLLAAGSLTTLQTSSFSPQFTAIYFNISANKHANKLLMHIPCINTYHINAWINA